MKNAITPEEATQLKQLAEVGFTYSKMLLAIPDSISIQYAGFYKSRGTRKFIAGMVKKFSSITLAIANGYSPEERARYLKEKCLAGQKK